MKYRGLGRKRVRKKLICKYEKQLSQYQNLIPSSSLIFKMGRVDRFEAFVILKGGNSIKWEVSTTFR